MIPARLIQLDSVYLDSCFVHLPALDILYWCSLAAAFLNQPLGHPEH